MEHMNIICAGNRYRTVGSRDGWGDNYYKCDEYLIYDRLDFILAGENIIFKHNINTCWKSPAKFIEEDIIKNYVNAGACFFALPVISDGWNFMAYDKYGRSVTLSGINEKSLFNLITGPRF